jgi:hypothetical protein
MAYPEAQLRLQWVYGYRGHQCRNNIHITHQGDVVYFVAGQPSSFSTVMEGASQWRPYFVGVAIILSLDGHKQRFYLQHDDDIIRFNDVLRLVP